jgi:hypothetical protein
MPQALPEVSVNYVPAFINHIYVTDSFSSAKKTVSSANMKEQDLRDAEH